MDKKLEILRAEQLALADEAGLNEELGAAVAVQVARVARPHEATKYRLHVEEVGKITSLLLGLSGRLARAENALFGLPGNHSERVKHFTVNSGGFRGGLMGLQPRATTFFFVKSISNSKELKKIERKNGGN